MSRELSPEFVLPSSAAPGAERPYLRTWSLVNKEAFVDVAVERIDDDGRNNQEHMYPSIQKSLNFLKRLLDCCLTRLAANNAATYSASTTKICPSD